MIEKYFKLGVRFRWAKPQNVDGPRDGNIVLSIRQTAPMNYIGLGEMVDPLLMQTHVSAFGLQMNMQIQHSWLDYAPGRTARIPTDAYDVLTGYMSGCIIARWSDGGITYVGHIGTVEADPETNRTVKNAFAVAMPPNTVGFNPVAVWDPHELLKLGSKFNPYKQGHIFALVTTQGQAYSVAMFQDGQDQWYCGGAKRVPPISHEQLNKLLT